MVSPAADVWKPTHLPTHPRGPQSSQVFRPPSQRTVFTQVWTHGETRLDCSPQCLSFRTPDLQRPNVSVYAFKLLSHWIKYHAGLHRGHIFYVCLVFLPENEKSAWNMTAKWLCGLFLLQHQMVCWSTVDTWNYNVHLMRYIFVSEHEFVFEDWQGVKGKKCDYYSVLRHELVHCSFYIW